MKASTRSAAAAACLAAILALSAMNAAAQAPERTAAAAPELTAAAEPAAPAVKKSTGLTQGRFQTGRTEPGSQRPDIPGAAGRTVKAMLSLAAIAAAGLYLQRQLRGKRTQSGDERVIQVIARQALTPRTSLVVVRAEEKKFLLSQNGDEVALLAELEPVSSFEDRLAALAIEERTELRAPQIAANA